jgi:ABC-type transport system involved in cytochrome bd biosynthesis fused ATPase/permease subunit
MKLGRLRLLLAKSGSRSLFLFIAIASAISTSLIILLAILMARIVVTLIQGSAEVSSEILAVFLLWILRALFQSQYEYWTTLQAIKIKAQLRNQITSGLESIDETSPALLTTLMVKGFNSLDIYLGRFLPQMAAAALTPISVVVAIAFFDPTSALIAVLTLPLIPFFGALIGKYTSDSVSKKWSTLGTLSRYFEDSLRGFVTLRIFGRHSTQAKRIRQMGDQYTKETIKVLRISFLSAFALELCATISVALIAVAIGLRLVNGQISFIAGLTVLLLAPEVYFPLRNAASLFHASADGKAALEEIEALMATARVPIVQVERDFTLFQKISWPDWTIDIPNVSKSQLPGAQVAAGEILFITGDSGVGKTSFAKNLLGLTHNAEITVNDQIRLTENLSQSWQKVIGWIPQAPHLATGTIAEQFRAVKPDISNLEIAESLRRVGLDLIELPEGLETFVGGAGEKSAAVSGGQLRKIAIARALLLRPALIIADEVSADLDEASTRIVMRELRRVVKDGAALICITHEIAMIHSDDRIITMENASINSSLLL